MLAGFRVATKEEERLPRVQHQYFPDNPYRINRILVYMFLRKHFGKPKNVGKIFSERKLQWEYMIRTPHGFIQALDKRRTSILFIPYSIQENKSSEQELEPVPIPDELKQDVDTFFHELENYADSVCVNGKFTDPPYSKSGILILNPFEIHYSNFKYHYKLLRKLITRLPNTDNYYTSDSYYKTKMLRDEIEKMKISSFILLMASFEGFINLVYEFFLRPEIREDDYVVDKISGEKIESKIRMLPVYCFGIKNNFSSFEAQMAEFRKLYRLRNKLVHANLSRFKYNNVVEIDGFLFQSHEDVDTEAFLYQSVEDTKKTTLEVLDSAKKTIDTLCKKILMLMKPAQRKDFRTVLHNYWVGYVYTKNGIKVLDEEIY